MTRRRSVDPAPFLVEVAVALRRPGQPGATFEALEHALGGVIGHRLFTVLRYHPDSGESERLHSNHPETYPVGGRKPLNPTPWTQRVLRDQTPYIGRTADDIRAVFFDHELIASLGCASVLNLPVGWDGRTLGTLNLLHEEGWYDEGDIAPGLVFAALAVSALLSPTTPREEQGLHPV